MTYSFVCLCYIFILITGSKSPPYWIVYSLLVSRVALVGVFVSHIASSFVTVIMPDPQDILKGFKLYPLISD